MGNTEFVIEPGRQDIIIRRVFDAPPDVVFKAFTDPAIVARWMGPTAYEVTIDHWDAAPGGTWRMLHRDPDGTDYAFKGVFHDLEAPGRLIRTFEYEGWPGHVALETATFEELDGKTRYVGVSVFQSVEDRDGMVKSGMEEGAGQGYDRLAEIVRSM